MTATVAGWMVNPDTTVPESRAPMMVGLSMVDYQCSVSLALWCLLRLHGLACWKRNAFHDPRCLEKSLNYDVKSVQYYV